VCSLEDVFVKMKKELKQIKVGFCVAYDWQLLAYSIPLIYPYADTICLSIDKDRISWSGNAFTWDELAFRDLITSMDPLHKIQLLEEDYHIASLQPMGNEVRQRNRIAEYMGAGGWHIQLDTDEFFLNFEAFVQYLQNIDLSRKFNVSCPWITLYKQTEDGFFYVKPDRYEQVEFIQVATLAPHYEYGRRNGYFNLHTDFAILHLSWARTEQEIAEKLNNWGHKNDFDTAYYFKLWQETNIANFKSRKDFHHIQPSIWPRLAFLPAKSVAELLVHKNEALHLPISPWKLRFENSIWVSRFKKYLNIR
jgi:hypothetical protein